MPCLHGGADFHARFAALRPPPLGAPARQRPRRPRAPLPSLRPRGRRRADAAHGGDRRYGARRLARRHDLLLLRQRNLREGAHPLPQGRPRHRPPRRNRRLRTSRRPFALFLSSLDNLLRRPPHRHCDFVDHPGFTALARQRPLDLRHRHRREQHRPSRPRLLQPPSAVQPQPGAAAHDTRAAQPRQPPPRAPVRPPRRLRLARPHRRARRRKRPSHPRHPRRGQTRRRKHRLRHRPPRGRGRRHGLADAARRPRRRGVLPGTPVLGGEGRPRDFLDAPLSDALDGTPGTRRNGVVRRRRPLRRQNGRRSAQRSLARRRAAALSPLRD